MGFLSRLFSGPKDAQIAVLADPTPAGTMTIVGDIHGCDELLNAALRGLTRDAGRLVFVGDLVDRGENTRTVLEIMHGLTGTHDVVCVMGNHERMLLDFLEDPADRGPRWLRYGGLQTLASYNIGGLSQSSSGDDVRDAATELAEKIGAERLAWLRGLPLFHISGNIAVVHAGANPAKPVDAQRPAALLWGHAEFGKTPRQDGMWVAHGHTIVPEATVGDGIIAVDTGAYATGVLSAVTLSKGKDPTVHRFTA